MAGSTDRHDEKRTFRILLAQGIFAGCGFSLNSVRLVLPYFYTALGAPLIFAGLIVPVFQAAKLFAQLFVAPAVHASRHNKGFVAVSLAGSALSLSVICLLVGVEPSTFMTLVFLAMVAVLSIATGISSLAFQDMIGHVLAENGRRRLLFAQSGLIGVATAAIALATQQLLPAATSRQAHTELMWAGIALLVVAAGLILLVQEPAKVPDAGRHDNAPAKRGIGRVVTDLKASFSRTTSQSWFRRFLLARALLLSVELAMPFYAIHAATLHRSATTGLSTFLIAASLGLAAGGILWPRIGAGSIKTVLTAATAVAALSGGFALAIDMRLLPTTVLLHAVIFALISFSAQGVQNGRKVYVLGLAPKEIRPHCIAVGNFITGIVAVGLAAGLGALAQIKGAVWPIYVVIALNLLGLLVLARLPGRADAPGPGAAPRDPR